MGGWGGGAMGGGGGEPRTGIIYAYMHACIHDSGSLCGCGIWGLRVRDRVLGFACFVGLVLRASLGDRGLGLWV